MTEPLDRHKARRVFEECLRTLNQTYTLTEEAIVEAQAEDEHGALVTVAYYRLFPDGRFECFQTLDEVLWPSL